MGASSSKSNDDSSVTLRTGSIRKSSKTRRSSQSKADQIETNSKIIDNLKNEIDIFAGDRTSERYKEFQKILTTIATELQQLKGNTKKLQQRDRCDEVLGQVQNCLQRLETKVHFNEQSESNLDLAAVESHSFINHSFKPQPPPPALLDEKLTKEIAPPKQRQPKFDSIKTLDHLEQETQNLEREIRTLIELEDTKQCVFYENKIKILYTDLEMIRVTEHTPLSERKANIGKRLIRCNNQIKKFKKGFDRKINTPNSTRDGATVSKPNHIKEEPLNDFSKIDYILEDLEIQALTFEGVKGEKKYKELEQILESHWTTVYAMDAFGDEERRRKSLTIDRAKNILQELRKRAEENEKQTKAIKAIHKVEQQLQLFKKEAEKFQGMSNDPSYIKLDQELRDAWSKIGEVDEPNEHVRRSKARVINDIQFVLKTLSQDTKKRESNIYENPPAAAIQQLTDDEILQNQLLKQVEEFQNHWNQLNYNLDVKTITKSEVSKAIISIFDKILEGIGKKSNALAIVEKRKSSSNLVIAKNFDKTDLATKSQPLPNQKSVESLYANCSVSPATYQSTYQPPDLIQQQVSKPMETEIKVQPSVKTIGEMQRIGSEAKVLLQQIRQSNCIKQDIEYKNFEIRLQQCKATLENIQYNKRSDTIESNRRRATKTINEALRALDEKPASKPVTEQAAIRSSKAQEVMDIDAGIQYFRQQIKNFVGVTKDKQYEKIKQGLAESLNKLQLIDDVQMPKQESIRQIQQYHQELETKLAENQAKIKIFEQNAEIRRQTSQDIKSVVEQVQKLRSQVDRFSGVYDGLHYKQIEGNLQSCSEKLDAIDSKGDDRLQNAQQQTKQKIHKYLRILEDKSSKTSAPEQSEPHQGHIVKDEVQHQQVYSIAVDEQQVQPSVIKENVQTSAAPVQRRDKFQRQSQVIDTDSPHHKINTLRDKLVDIKNKTETFEGKHKDQQYSDIEKQLLGCFDELKSINDRGHKSVIISKEQYADYIEKLLEYFEEKTKTTETAEEEQIETINIKIKATEGVAISNPIQVKQSLQTFKITDPTEELAAIEEQLPQVKNQINNFQVTATDTIYANLNQVIFSYITKLEGVQAGNVAHVRERKRKLAEELQDCAMQLDEKEKHRQEVKKIKEILDELEQVSKEVSTFEGVKNDKAYCYLDEVLIKFTILLDNTQTYGNTELRNARKKAIQEIQRNMKILTERALPKEDAGAGGGV